ncbi:hypothetical protein GLW05_15375 [Pontibacillus yanchengensis]|uniref:DUF3899 domain-containing protein n=1 Tax=Pontibacillus yanchengensis TaxID=462910 RepID=A0A6I5A047_9BACI|nr:hypothetical protein [Pontibacillus yanchengensis]MYL34964.1 hypothetical protein [Pontibacillus yanchengensis]
MKNNVIIVVSTIMIEALFLGLLSYLMGWKFIDTAFVGGLALFGVNWLSSFSESQSSNVLNATVKGWTGLDAGGIKLFRFTLSPIRVGLLLFMLIAIIGTFTFYSSYILG